MSCCSRTLLNFLYSVNNASQKLTPVWKKWPNHHLYQLTQLPKKLHRFWRGSTQVLWIWRRWRDSAHSAISNHNGFYAVYQNIWRLTQSMINQGTIIVSRDGGWFTGKNNDYFKKQRAGSSEMNTIQSLEKLNFMIWLKCQITFIITLPPMKYQVSIHPKTWYLLRWKDYCCYGFMMNFHSPKYFWVKWIGGTSLVYIY